MSVLTSVVRTSPNGKNEECARFKVTDGRESFTIYDVMSTGKTYIFTFWIRSDANGRIAINGQSISTSSTWTKNTMSIAATTKDVVIKFTETGTYYIYHPKLETGTLPTDWSPAPEDHDQAVLDATNQTNIAIKEQTDAVRDSCESMIGDATKDLATNDNLESFKEIVESRFLVEKDEIAMEFYAAYETINGVSGTVNDKFTELYKYITFDENGITIGSGDSAITLQLDNKAGIIFKKDGKQFGLWDGTDFYTGNIVVRVEERAQLGNFAYIPRSDGSLSFLKVGG